MNMQLDRYQPIQPSQQQSYPAISNEPQIISYPNNVASAYQINAKGSELSSPLPDNRMLQNYPNYDYDSSIAQNPNPNSTSNNPLASQGMTIPISSMLNQGNAQQAYKNPGQSYQMIQQQQQQLQTVQPDDGQTMLQLQIEQFNQPIQQPDQIVPTKEKKKAQRRNTSNQNKEEKKVAASSNHAENSEVQTFQQAIMNAEEASEIGDQQQVQDPHKKTKSRKKITLKQIEKLTGQLRSIQSGAHKPQWFNFGLSNSIERVKPQMIQVQPDPSCSIGYNEDDYRKGLRNFEQQQQLVEWALDDEIFMERIRLNEYLQQQAWKLNPKKVKPGIPVSQLENQIIPGQDLKPVRKRQKPNKAQSSQEIQHDHPEGPTSEEVKKSHKDSVDESQSKTLEDQSHFLPQPNTDKSGNTKIRIFSAHNSNNALLDGAQTQVVQNKNDLIGQQRTLNAKHHLSEHKLGFSNSNPQQQQTLANKAQYQQTNLQRQHSQRQMNILQFCPEAQTIIPKAETLPLNQSQTNIQDKQNLQRNLKQTSKNQLSHMAPQQQSINSHQVHKKNSSDTVESPTFQNQSMSQKQQSKNETQDEILMDSSSRLNPDQQNVMFKTQPINKTSLSGVNQEYFPSNQITPQQHYVENLQSANAYVPTGSYMKHSSSQMLQQNSVSGQPNSFPQSLSSSSYSNCNETSNTIEKIENMAVELHSHLSTEKAISDKHSFSQFSQKNQNLTQKSGGAPPNNQLSDDYSRNSHKDLNYIEGSQFVFSQAEDQSSEVVPGFNQRYQRSKVQSPKFGGNLSNLGKIQVSKSQDGDEVEVEGDSASLGAEGTLTAAHNLSGPSQNSMVQSQQQSNQLSAPNLVDRSISSANMQQAYQQQAAIRYQQMQQQQLKSNSSQIQQEIMYQPPIQGIPSWHVNSGSQGASSNQNSFLMPYPVQHYSQQNPHPQAHSSQSSSGMPLNQSYNQNLQQQPHSGMNPSIIQNQHQYKSYQTNQQSQYQHQSKSSYSQGQSSGALSATPDNNSSSQLLQKVSSYDQSHGSNLESVNIVSGTLYITQQDQMSSQLLMGSPHVQTFDGINPNSSISNNSSSANLNNFTNSPQSQSALNKPLNAQNSDLLIDHQSSSLTPPPVPYGSLYHQQQQQQQMPQNMQHPIAQQHSQQYYSSKQQKKDMILPSNMVMPQGYTSSSSERYQTLNQQQMPHPVVPLQSAVPQNSIPSYARYGPSQMDPSMYYRMTSEEQAAYSQYMKHHLLSHPSEGNAQQVGYNQPRDPSSSAQQQLSYQQYQQMMAHQQQKQHQLQQSYSQKQPQYQQSTPPPTSNGQPSYYGGNYSQHQQLQPMQQKPSLNQSEFEDSGSSLINENSKNTK